MKTNNGYRLLQSARSGKSEECRKYLIMGYNPNHRYDNGVTAMMVAAANGDTSTCTMLCNYGADVNLADNTGMTAAMYAARKGHFFEIQTKEITIDYNATNKNGETAAYIATVNNHEDCAHRYAKKTDNYHLNKISEANNTTILMEAASNGYNGLCKMLIDAGATISEHTISFAKNNNNQSLERFLIICKLDNTGMNQLMHAASNNEYDKCKELIAIGAPIRHKNKKGETALTYALKSDNKAICKLLLNKAIEQEEGLYNKSRAIDWVCEEASISGSNEIYRSLVKIGEDNNYVPRERSLSRDVNLDSVIDDIQDTQLHSAVASGNEVSTPLMIAAKNGNLKLCKKLLSKGANPDAIDEYGNTILVNAINSENNDLCNLLIEKNLFHKSANLEIPDADGNTPLMIAAKNGNLKLCKKLLSNGANLNAVNKEGNTALILAAQMGNLEVCRKLLSKGINPNDVNNEGNTALILAAQMGNCDVCGLLLSKGANINEANKRGVTALIIAAKFQQILVYELLVENEAEQYFIDDTGNRALNYFNCDIIITPTNTRKKPTKSIVQNSKLTEESSLDHKVFESHANLSRCENIEEIPTADFRAGVDLTGCKKLKNSNANIATLYNAKQHSPNVKPPEHLMFQSLTNLDETKQLINNLRREYAAKSPNTFILLDGFLNESRNERESDSKLISDISPILELITLNPDNLLWIEKEAGKYLGNCVNQRVQGVAVLAAYANIMLKNSLEGKLEAAKQIIVTDVVHNYVIKNSQANNLRRSYEAERGNSLLCNMRDMLKKGNQWTGIPSDIANTSEQFRKEVISNHEAVIVEVTKVLTMGSDSVNEYMQTYHGDFWTIALIPDVAKELDKKEAKALDEIASLMAHDELHIPSKFTKDQTITDANRDEILTQIGVKIQTKKQTEDIPNAIEAYIRSELETQYTQAVVGTKSVEVSNTTPNYTGGGASKEGIHSQRVVEEREKSDNFHCRYI